MTEDASAPTLSTTVTIDFNDVDLSDTLDYSVVKSSGTLGGTLDAAERATTAAPGRPAR